jgi:hypothetical protein
VSIQTEAGETVIPPCFDETGDLIYHAVQTETEDLNDPVTYRDHLEKRFDEMAAELRRLQGQDGSATDDAEVDIPVR